MVKYYLIINNYIISKLREKILGNYFISAFIIAILFYLAYVYYRHTSSAKTSKHPEAQDKSITERSFKNLLKLNIQARTRLTETVCIEALEIVVDLIRLLSPQINDRLPNSQMAWIINRMDTEYLPKLLDPFIQLSPETRKNQQDSFLAALSSIQKELEEVRDMLNSSDEDQFNSKATFIKQRFSNLY